MSHELVNAFAALDQHTEPIPLDVLQAWIAESCPTLEELKSFLQFRPERYQRNLIYAGPTYQALLLCWLSGQRSPIHDHTGSACAVRVMQGTATETVFERAPNGMVYATSSRHLSAGQICGSFDSDMHQVSNLQADGANLATLHIYSPPLIEMNVYSLETDKVGRFIDPINTEFVLGAGI